MTKRTGKDKLPTTNEGRRAALARQDEERERYRPAEPRPRPTKPPVDKITAARSAVQRARERKAG